MPEQMSERIAEVKTVHKAVPCVVQADALLCFVHPSAGNQIPKGTVEPDEPPALAALRELAEESGVQHPDAPEYFGQFERFVGSGPAESGPLERHVWHLFLLKSTDLPSQWVHIASGSPEEDNLQFAYFWQPLQAPAEGFHAVYLQVIDQLKRRLYPG